MSTLTHPTTAAHGDAFHRILDIATKMVAAVREAMTAMRVYERNRARGVSHADAVTRAFEAGYNT